MKTFLKTHPLAVTPEDMFVHIASPLVTHEMGWGRMEPVHREVDAECVIMLTPQMVMHEMFGKKFSKDHLSVCDMSTREIWINEDRWRRIIPDKSQLPLPAYRVYVLQHEIGHALGLGHASKTSGPSPVMVQQTLGIGNHTPNPFPLEREKDILERSKTLQLKSKSKSF